MPVVHQIALRGPWRYEWLGEGVPDSVEGISCLKPEATGQTAQRSLSRTQMPTDWATLFGDQRGRVRFVRRFHAPTGLEPTDRVVLCFNGVGGSAVFELNGQFLGGACQSRDPVRFDITQQIEPGNLLEVIIDYDSVLHGPQGGLWGVVLVEIHSP